MDPGFLPGRPCRIGGQISGHQTGDRPGQGQPIGPAPILKPIFLLLACMPLAREPNTTGLSIVDGAKEPAGNGQSIKANGAEKTMARGRLCQAATLILVLGISGCGKNSGVDYHAVAGAVLERVGGVGVFDDASTAQRAAIRHTPSGLVCPLPRDGAFDLEAFPADAKNPGAFCSHASNDVATTLVAVRFGPETNLDTAFSESVALSAGQQPAQAWSGAPSAADLASPEGLPHFRIARLQVSMAEEQRYLRVAVSEANGWYVQQIVSAPIGQAEKAEAEAGLEWRQLLRDFLDTP